MVNSFNLPNLVSDEGVMPVNIKHQEPLIFRLSPGSPAATFRNRFRNRLRRLAKWTYIFRRTVRR